MSGDGRSASQVTARSLCQKALSGMLKEWIAMLEKEKRRVITLRLLSEFWLTRYWRQNIKFNLGLCSLGLRLFLLLHNDRGPEKFLIPSQRKIMK